MDSAGDPCGMEILSDFGKNVVNIGFIECCKSKTLSAKVFERRADKIKLLAVDDQKAVVECH